jgi:hypothetical protein
MELFLTTCHRRRIVGEMATGGGSGASDGVADHSDGVRTEFYRVLVIGIPAPNKELFVKEKLGGLLPGEVVDINTLGTPNAVVTLRCEQGLSCEVPLEQDVDAGCVVTLYNQVSQNVYTPHFPAIDKGV